MKKLFGQSLNEKIKSFILNGLDENSRLRQAKSFLAEAGEVGTELWLDTGDMDEAEKNWSAEMTVPLTTNNALVNKKFKRVFTMYFIAKAKGLVKDLPLRQQITGNPFYFKCPSWITACPKKFGGFCKRVNCIPGYST